MKKYISIILLAIMMVGCDLRYDIEYTMYNNGYKITTKMLSTKYDYTYLYELEDQETGGKIRWYSNKNYGVDDIIWMGAKWGRNMSKDVDNN